MGPLGNPLQKISCPKFDLKAMFLSQPPLQLCWTAMKFLLAPFLFPVCLKAEHSEELLMLAEMQRLWRPSATEITLRRGNLGRLQT